MFCYTCPPAGSQVHRENLLKEDNALKRLSDVIAIQNEIATAGLDPEPVMEIVVQRVQVLTSASGAAVELLDGENLVTRAASGNALPRLGLTAHLSGSVSGYCIETGEVLLSNNTAEDSRINRQAASAIGAASMVVVPLYHRGKVVGVLKVFSAATNAFSDLDLQTLQLMTGVIGAAINGASLYAQARHDAAKFFHSATHDALTGLANRALFFDRLDYQLALAKRQSSSLAIYMLDMNGFKKINDSLGHQTGDLALIEVGKRLTQAVRECDTVARMGGDEFAIHLVGVCDVLSANAGIERIKGFVNKPFLANGNPLALRASIGAALYPQDGTSIEALLAVADRNMYSNKKAGLPKPAPFHNSL